MLARQARSGSTSRPPQRRRVKLINSGGRLVDGEKCALSAQVAIDYFA